MRSISRILWTLSIAAAWTAPVASQVAILVDSASPATWSADVKAKLEGSGVPLGTVTVIDLTIATPTVAQLQAFRSVLVYNSNPFHDAGGLGNNLHDYVDGGGGVVVALFAHFDGQYATLALGGTWKSQNYGPIRSGLYYVSTPLQLGTRYFPGHPLFAASPVNSFDGGSFSARCVGTTNYFSTRLADWSNGDIFAAERYGLNGRVLALNFFPPSSDASPELWLASTDGDNLLANALWYVANCPITKTYCTSKTNSLGCNPIIYETGSSASTATSGFTVYGLNVRNQSVGLLLYSFNGRAAIPFQGGLLCLQSPIHRCPSVNSGGTALPQVDCTGWYVIDMNAFASGALGGTPQAALSVMGTGVDCQWWGPDPGFAPPNDTTLSNALEYFVCL